LDIKIRRGELPFLRGPRILGFEVSGVVCAVGKNVTKFKPGDEVFCMVNTGGAAEYTAAAEEAVAFKPRRLTHVEAASIPMACLASYQSLIEKAHMRRGDRVLIHGGSGGVGSIAIQFAKIMGAFVATTCSTKNVDFCKLTGADIVVDYTKEKFEDVLGKGTMDICLETVGAENLKRSYSVLKPSTGRLVALQYGVSTAIYHFITSRLKGPKFYPVLVDSSRGDQLERLADLFEKGEMKPVVGQVLLLSQAKEGHEILESGRVRGKVVFTVETVSIVEGTQ